MLEGNYPKMTPIFSFLLGETYFHKLATDVLCSSNLLLPRIESTFDQNLIKCQNKAIN